MAINNSLCINSSFFTMWQRSTKSNVLLRQSATGDMQYISGRYQHVEDDYLHPVDSTQRVMW